jgi:glycosyltransferase involved in cell wall biosynthesis
MDVSIVIPVQASDVASIALTVQGATEQQYDDGRIEVLVVQFGSGPRLSESPRGLHHSVRLLSIDDESPYAARNLGVRMATGSLLLFTEPGCVPDPGWARAYARAFRGGRTTIGVGRVAPTRETRALRMFLAYEDARDEWVFSAGSWPQLFGRPKNMAMSRARFESHGPFVEVMRGADSKLVQRVAREVSPAEVSHVPDALVRLARARGLPSWFGDRFAHARALRIHRSGHAAPIAFSERARVFRRTIAANGYGAVGSAALLGLLAAGVVVFRVGDASARFARRRSG